ncbi:Tn3 family transposase [Streptomyces sp. NPDC099050]|uniref:Tn3 family transposase n=1 Tax=Streptomyces sp. NPDC099050 TaxID=3366100 RepID=UPI00382A3AF6
MNDQVMGLGGVVVPGTLRDSLFILDALHNRDGGPRPHTAITDTAPYSDIVFGLFAICGYQFSPGSPISATPACGAPTPPPKASRHTVRLDRVHAHWGITEARHRLARKIFFGQRGELRQHYREGMEDQPGALDLALNTVVLWNSLYLDRAAKQLAGDGFPVTDDLLARLSPLQFDHINFLGRYAFLRPPGAGRRPLCEPSADLQEGQEQANQLARGRGMSRAASPSD